MWKCPLFKPYFDRITGTVIYFLIKMLYVSIALVNLSLLGINMVGYMSFFFNFAGFFSVSSHLEQIPV